MCTAFWWHVNEYILYYPLYLFIDTRFITLFKKYPIYNNINYNFHFMTYCLQLIT
jgi:hypothetical protein